MKARLTILATAVALLLGTPHVAAHADVDDGAGSGSRVAVLAGAFAQPERTMQQLRGSVCAPPIFASRCTT